MFLNLPIEIIIHEINKHLVDIDRQIFRKTSIFFLSLFPFKSIKFNSTVLELVHIKRYLAKARDIDTMDKIVSQGDLESLKYLRSPKSGEQCPWGCSTTAMAAMGGHLECLKYLHENGCPWDAWTTECASIGKTRGHLECLEYARENGCAVAIERTLQSYFMS